MSELTVTSANVGYRQRRMSSDPEPAADGTELVRVRLTGVPVQPLLATEMFQRSVLRELDLMFVSAEHEGTRPGAPMLLAREILQGYEAGYQSVLAAAEAAAQADQRTLDIDLTLPRRAAEAAGIYLRLMEEVDEDARRMRLLTPPDPEVSRFRRWFVEQIVAQLQA